MFFCLTFLNLNFWTLNLAAQTAGTTTTPPPPAQTTTTTTQSSLLKDVKVTVSPGGGTESTNIPSSGMVTRTFQRDLIVRIVNSCFGVNLRGVGNPISPNAIVRASINLSIGGKDIPISVAYPTMLTTEAGMTAAEIKPMQSSKYSIPGGGSAGIYGNVVQLNIPQQTSVTVGSDGTYKSENFGSVSVTSTSFIQEITSCDGPGVYGAYGYSTFIPSYPCGAYMGVNGPLSTTLNGINVASDNSSVEIKVAFPGQVGFCGGYFSPLMIFEDDQRPTFNNVVDFKLGLSNKTAWPDANTVGYFLVFDRNKNKQVDNKDELFGESEKHRNGFEALKELDSNNDGIIDSKDKEFKNLWLWNDKNGNAKVDPDELIPLGSKINSISLAYKEVLRALGENAEERQVSSVKFKAKKGKEKPGTIVDIWFRPK